MKNSTKNILLARHAMLFGGLFMLIIFAGALFPTVPASASLTSITPENVLTLVNIERHAAQLPALSMNDDLTRAAQAKLADIFRNHYFAHTAPDGTTPWFWIEQSGYPYVYAGENLAMSFRAVTDQHRAWMNSATHRQNILSDRYDEIGIAVGQGVVNGVSTTVAVQLFGSQHFAVAQKPATDSAVQQNEAPVMQAPSHQTASYVPAAVPSTQAVQYSLRDILPISSEELLRGVAWLLIVLMTMTALSVDSALFLRTRRQGMTQSS